MATRTWQFGPMRAALTLACPGFPAPHGMTLGPLQLTPGAFVAVTEHPPADRLLGNRVTGEVVVDLSPDDLADLARWLEALGLVATRPTAQ